MAPDRGALTTSSASPLLQHEDGTRLTVSPRSTDVKATPSISGRSFTIRGVLVGLMVGLVICFSNMYFGLQTGWVSTMTMPASLMGFAFFKTLSRHLRLPFSPVENVLVQTVAGSMAIMPLGCGFVGVVPAMNYLLTTEEQGPIKLSLWKLIVWSLGLCYFGVIFAVPLRRQVIIRERLRFPSGFSTAVLIGVLHGQTRQASAGGSAIEASGGFASLVPENNSTSVADEERSHPESHPDPEQHGLLEPDGQLQQDWASNMRLLMSCFLASGLYTLCTYFFPALRNIPIFGKVAGKAWLWTLNPSPAYVGQGIIMGPETTLHMTLGAVIGWGILSPLAKYNGWAPGSIDDWEHGSKGWIVWVSLAIMLADAIVSLAYIALRPLGGVAGVSILRTARRRLLWLVPGRLASSYPPPGYSAVYADESEDTSQGMAARPTPRSDPSSLQHSPIIDDDDSDFEDADAPPEQLISNKTVSIGLVASVVLCVVTIRIVFGALVPLYATVIAVLMALLLSIMGVRALGETDLNPVSGISKLSQLFFALIIPQTHKSSVLINLVAGAVSEAGALQAGDLMQDLKTGHLLGAAPNAQFWGQIIGATAGAITSACIYQLYTAVYQIPGDLFQVPTGYVWIFTARLVTGKGLPYMAKEWALGFGVIFAVVTIIRTISIGKPWRKFVPGGIAVAVGMYNVPSFTLARTAGGLLSWYWLSSKGRSSTPLIVLASGFILGEGFLSIVNLILQSLGVPHY